MRMGKYGILVAITLICVVALAGSAQAGVTVAGSVNSTEAQGEIVTLWLDVNPSDYTTKAVLDAGDPNNDYYWFDDLTPILDRNGYSSGNTDIPVTVAMYCSGTERNIDGVSGSPYTNADRNVAVAHGTVDYADGTFVPSMMELEPCEIEETFSKTLYEGWNLISLPLVPEDNSASAVLTNILYNAVYRYNAETKQFDPASTMDPGVGYFVHVTSDCTWEYSGTSYTSMSTELKQGLNMIGWLNCPKDIGEALSSISGEYHYVAQWNTQAQKFEVYNPAAPLAFNDFTTMDQGTGYFISARQDCTLFETC
jgi:hypothetical protein